MIWGTIPRFSYRVKVNHEKPKKKKNVADNRTEILTRDLSNRMQECKGIDGATFGI